MKKVVLNQPPLFAAKVILVLPFFFVSIALIEGNFYMFPVFVLMTLFMFAGYAYEFNENLAHKLNIKTFNITIFSFNKKFIEPEYVSLFNQPFKSLNSFGFMVLGQTRYKEFTIKLFNNSKHEIVYRSNKKEEVLRLGKELAKLFKVELHNTLE